MQQTRTHVWSASAFAALALLWTFPLLARLRTDLPGWPGDNIAFAWNFWSVAATVVIWTFGEMFFFPGMAAYVTDIAPASRRGEYMGLAGMSMNLGFAVGPWAGTTVLDRFGGKTLWLGAFALGLVATAMMMRLTDEAPAHVPSAAARPP